ncbi:MAG: tetratricopeptide repeat protein [bacterium]|nr:tetratricopeptide repeat protein [bacterium]
MTRSFLRLLVVITVVGSFVEYEAIGAEPLPEKSLITLGKLKPDIAKPKPATDSEVPPRAQKAVVKARELINSGKYALAVPLLVERALGFAPNCAEVHRLLAEAYMKLPDAGKALVHMQKAVKLDSDNITAQIQLSQLYIAQKRKNQAIIALRTALLCSQSKPDNPLTGEALFRLGRLLGKEGYWQASLDCFNTLGVNIDKHGRRYASRPMLRNMVLRPQRLLIRRGELLARLRRPKKAIPLLKRAFNRDRTNANLAELLVGALAADRQYKEVEKFLVELTAQAAVRAKIPALASKTAVASGDKGMPMRIWKACQAADRDSGKMAVELARAAEKLGSPADASAILQSVLDSDPSDVSVTKFMAALYAVQGKGDKVLGLLGKLLRADPARDDIVPSQLAALDRAGVSKDFARKFAGKIASAPKDQRASLHYLTGHFGQLRGDKSLALAQYVKAIDADPTFLPTYAHLSEIYAKKGQKDKLAELLKHLKKLPAGQESVAFYHAWGKVHLAMADVPAAEKMFRKAYEANRRYVPSLEAMGDTLILGGRIREAVAFYREVERLDPLRRGLSGRLFEAYMEMRGFRDAKKLADEAIRKGPKSRDAKIMLARVLLASGHSDAASTLLDELKARTGDDERLRLLAIRVDIAGTESVMFKKDFDKAVAALEKITGSDRTRREADRILAAVMVQNGQYVRAAELLAKILKKRSDNTVLRLRAKALIAAGKYEEASAAIRETLAVMPNDEALQNRLFTCLKLAGKNDQAASMIKQKLLRATDADKATKLRARLLFFLQEAKSYDRLQKFMDDWIMVDTSLAEVLQRLKIEIYTTADKHAIAIAYAEKLLKKSPQSQAVKRCLVEAIIASKSPEKAHPLLDKWIAEQRRKPERDDSVDPFGSSDFLQSPKQLIARFQEFKINAYAAAGKFDQAEAYVTACLKEDPSNIGARSGLIDAFYSAKKYDKVITRLDAWIKELSATATTAPAGSEHSKTTGEQLERCKQTVLRVMLLKKDYKKVILRAGEYLKGDPKNIKLLSLRSSAFNESGQPDKALVDMRKIYELEPDIPDHWNNLGYQLANMGLELRKGETLIRRALVEADASSTSYVAPLDSLAWALYKQGKLHSAGRVFLEVIRLSRERKYKHPILYDHAGDAFYRLGWTDRAVELWTQALKVAEDDKTDTREVRQVKRITPGKIKDVKSGKPTNVAPLGKGVKIEDK